MSDETKMTGIISVAVVAGLIVIFGGALKGCETYQGAITQQQKICVDAGGSYINRLGDCLVLRSAAPSTPETKP